MASLALADNGVGATAAGTPSGHPPDTVADRGASTQEGAPGTGVGDGGTTHDDDDGDQAAGGGGSDRGMDTLCVPVRVYTVGDEPLPPASQRLVMLTLQSAFGEEAVRPHLNLDQTDVSLVRFAVCVRASVLETELQPPSAPDFDGRVLVHTLPHMVVPHPAPLDALLQHRNALNRAIAAAIVRGRVGDHLHFASDTPARQGQLEAPVRLGLSGVSVDGGDAPPFVAVFLWASQPLHWGPDWRNAGDVGNAAGDIGSGDGDGVCTAQRTGAGNAATIDGGDGAHDTDSGSGNDSSCGVGVGVGVGFDGGIGVSIGVGIGVDGDVGVGVGVGVGAGAGVGVGVDGGVGLGDGIATVTVIGHSDDASARTNPTVSD